MIDFDVAYDKLSSLETADEIADLFRAYEVKADRFNSASCAVSVWMSDQTGMIIRTNNNSLRAVQSDLTTISETVRRHTPAIDKFIMNFDYGLYPELAKE